MFASADRICVAGTLNGVTIQGTLIPEKKGSHRLYVNGGMRAAARLSVGDSVAVRLRAIPATEVVIASDRAPVCPRNRTNRSVAQFVFH